MPDTIPFLDLPGQHRALWDQLRGALEKQVLSAGFIGGTYVDDFEAAFARYCGTQHCVGVANGTDALALALRVMDVGPQDVVVVPAFTFIATAEAVSMRGATLRFVDVDPQTYTIDPRALEQVDPTGVKAVIPVHLYGQLADMDPIMAFAKDRGWRVLEDAAQAHGATYKGRTAGSIAELGSFSFYPGKNLGAMGDAGAVVGNDADQLDRLRRLSNHGRTTKYEHGEWGVNSRLDAIQAMALGVKLPHLGDWNASRARVAGWYDARLADLDGMTTPVVGGERTHVYHLYVVQVDDRDRLLDTLRREDIGCGVHYGKPLHLQEAYRDLGHGLGDFPVSEQIGARCLSLPMFPSMNEAQVDRVADLVRAHVVAGS